jgi:hypothetical protein
VFGVLVLVAVARYAGEVAWDSAAAWVLLLLAVAVTATGTAGWRSAPVPARDRP